MSRSVTTKFALVIFATVVVILLLPYVIARYRPVEPLPPSDSQPNQAAVIGVPNTLKIADLGIEAPILYIEEKSEAVYQTALRSGVVHYPGTAMPGQPGNVYIFGHSSDYIWTPGDYKTIFVRLPQIEIGEEIEITDANGKIYLYKVVEAKVVGPRDLSVLDQYNLERSMLTLQTSYPLGTALQRFIAIAELVPLEDAEDDR